MPNLPDIELFEADREAAAAEVYRDFVAIVRRLRRECPWDREQTHESVKHLLIEEAYETVEAIEEKNWPDLKKELGDLFLHVLFHAEMAEGAGTFTLRDVMEAEMEKLIRRHPHVFGDATVSGTAEVLTNWEKIKLKEKKSVLEGVPKQLPALLRAYRMQEKAAGVGFDFPDAEGAWEKVQEEIGEFHALVHVEAAGEEKEQEFGDLLFALVNYARFTGINPENALRRTNEKFIRRFQHVEQRVKEQGRSLADSSLAEMDRYWNEAKSEE